MHYLIILAAALFVIANPLPTSAALIVQNTGGYDPYLIAWADGDKLLATKSRRGELRTWQVSTGLMLQSLPPGEPMNSELLLESGGSTIGFIKNRAAVVIDRRSGEKIWHSQDAGVPSIGQLASQTIMIANAFGLHLMDYRKNLKLASWKPENYTMCRYMERMGNGRIAAIMANQSVTFLNEKTLTPLSEIQVAGNQPFYYATVAKKGAMLALATFNGTLLADADKPAEGFRVFSKSPGVNGVALSNDGEKIAIGSSGAIEIRSTRTGDMILDVKFKSSINRMAWSDNDQQLAITTSEHGIFVINSATGEIVQNFGQPINISPPASRPNCAISDDGRMVALIDERKNLTQIDLADTISAVTPFSFTSSPEMMAWSDANLLMVFTESSCRKIDANGIFRKAIRPFDDAFEAGPCGMNEIFFRNSDRIGIFDWKENEAIRAGGFPVRITRRCEFSNDGRFALVRENGDAGALSIRAAPTWNVVAQVPEIAADPLPEGVLSHPEGTSLTWIDTKSRVVTFDLETKRYAVLGELPKDAIQRCIRSTPTPDWFVGSSAFTNPPTYLIVGRDSGKTVFESRPWDAFTDEIDLVPIAVAPDRKHLWLCGPAGHPILLNLKTAKPVLRIHTWSDGGFVFETPGRRFHANESGQRRIHDVNATCDAAETREDLVKSALDRSKISELLKSVRSIP